MLKKSKDKIKWNATWVDEKEIWMLRTSKKFLENLIKGTTHVENDDINKVKFCIDMIGHVINNQIELNNEAKNKG